MKKIQIALLMSTLLLASCTMPWAKTTEKTTDEIIPADETDSNTGNTGEENGTKKIDTPIKADTGTPIENTAEVNIVPSDTPKAIAEGGVYLPYTSTAIAQAKGKVVLFFHASWCPTCIAINKDIEAHLASLPKDVTILKVNYDEASDLKEAYGVTAQYTFVQVDNDAKLIKKWRG
jgi:thiol-disulfide isomerase/thioredoxin